MKRLCALVAALTIWVPLGTTLLDACGAKFLVATGSVFWQRSQRTPHPAKILVYQHSRDAEVVEFVAKLRAMLKEMGHEVTVADSEAGLLGRSGEYNVVMLALSEARRLKSGITAGMPQTKILPIKAFPNQPEIALARQEFGRLLVLPAAPKEVFSTVEAAHR
jgi:hypothetical protein